MSIFSPNLLVTLRFIKRKLRSILVQYSFRMQRLVILSAIVYVFIMKNSFLMRQGTLVICETLGVVFMFKCILQSCVNISRLLNSIRAGLSLTHIPI